jgi:2'-5' RNA ligase
MNAEYKRCFVALELPEEMKKFCTELQDKLRKNEFVDANFTEKENIHLTLKFIGEINNDDVKLVSEKLKTIKFGKIRFELGDAGVFSEQNIRIIWLSLKGHSLMEIQKRIDDALKDKYKSEFRFMAHITLARVKNVRNKKGLLDYLEKIKIPKISGEITEFQLKESILTPQGPEYTTLERYKMTNA